MNVPLPCYLQIHPHQQKHNDQQSDNDPVITKNLESMLCQVGDKTFYCQHGNDKGNNIPQYQQQDIVFVKRQKILVHFEHRSSQHGWNSQKERELGCVFPGKFLGEASYDCGC